MRTKLLIFLLLAVGYLLSPPFAFVLAAKLPHNWGLAPVADKAVDIYITPSMELAKICPPYSALIDWEFRQVGFLPEDAHELPSMPE